LLVELVRLLVREEVSAGKHQIEGEVSDWATNLEKSLLPPRTTRQPKSPEQSAERLFAMQMSTVRELGVPTTLRQLGRFMENVTAKDLQMALQACRKGDATTLSICNEVAERIARRIGLSSDGVVDPRILFPKLRAARTLLLCFAIHRQRPTVLISRAKRGDRRAALDLVKVDPLFMHDHCTAAVMRQAELQNDRQFLQQVARAQRHRPQMSGRTRGKIPQRVHLYLLFLAERWFGGLIPLPAFRRWQLVDPEGQDFDNEKAFERFSQRCRKEFDLLLRESPGSR
jgi:hypothetical protein